MVDFGLEFGMRNHNKTNCGLTPDILNKIKNIFNITMFI